MTIILGILNITDDSFSDGGKYLDPAAAIAHGKAMIVDGADVLDVGAASSNPDSRGVPPEMEIARLESVLTALPVHRCPSTPSRCPCSAGRSGRRSRT
jgi:dihydropteroate synthase